MKKLLTIVSALAVSATGLLAQGTIDFHTSNTQPLKVIDPTQTTSTVNASGSPLQGASVRVALLVRPAGGSFIQVGMVTNSASTSSLFLGTFNGGTSYALPTQAGFATGNTVDVEFAAWSISTGALDYTSALAATTGYVTKGPLQVLTGYSLGGGAVTPGIIFGSGANQLQSLVLTQVPEPSTLALGALGVASLAFFRRRKVGDNHNKIK
jgi:hypothetical protein